MARRKPSRLKKRERKAIPRGRAYIQSTFNNTIITLTDPQGNVIAWGSSGTAGFKGSRKGTAYAAQRAAEATARRGWNTACARSMSMSEGPEAGERRRFVPFRLQVSISPALGM